LFIINPASARGTTLRRWVRAREKIVALGIDFAEHVTMRAGDATDVTREALTNGTARVIAVGGDGTLGEVVNGYLDETGRAINEAVSIGLLPSGTGSDFARSLGLTPGDESISTAVGSETRLLDAARADFRDRHGVRASRIFMNVASFGLGGDVSALVNRWRNSVPRWVGGRVRFAAAAVAALGRYKNVPVSLRVDECEIEISSNLIVVANGRFAGGGMMLAPHASLDDGLVDLIMTDRANRLDVIRELPRIQRGGYLKNFKVTELRAREVSITTEAPMAIDLDGEMVGFTPARVTVLPSVVRLAAS
jgi:YegS/Rv2252/BmrU family lipid kinase